MSSCSPHDSNVPTVILPEEGTERYHCCGHRKGKPIPTRRMGLLFILKEPGRRRRAKQRWGDTPGLTDVAHALVKGLAEEWFLILLLVLIVLLVHKLFWPL